MKNIFKLTLLSVFALIFGFQISFTQEEKEKDKEKEKSKDKEKVQILPDKDFDFDFDFGNFKFSMTTNNVSEEWKKNNERPFINFNVGNSILKSQEYENVNFDKVNVAAITLGYYVRSEHTKSIVTKTSIDEIFITNTSDIFNKHDANSQNIKGDFWRFGYNSGKGYGYKFSDYFGLNFMYKDGSSWTLSKFEPNQYFEAGKSDTFNFNTYNESIRFGEQFESIASIEVLKYLSFNASYERINVYPRHLFWAWLGGKIIEEAAQGLLGSFIKEIRKYSPEFTPVINLILRTGLSYGLYELRKKNMNWPFDTAPPFTFENIKFGLQFNF
jgi:hypothetical protein